MDSLPPEPAGELDQTTVLGSDGEDCSSDYWSRQLYGSGAKGKGAPGGAGTHRADAAATILNNAVDAVAAGSTAVGARPSSTTLGTRVGGGDGRGGGGGGAELLLEELVYPAVEQVAQRVGDGTPRFAAAAAALAGLQNALRRTQDALPDGALTRDFLAFLFHRAQTSTVPEIRRLYDEPSVSLGANTAAVAPGAHISAVGTGARQDGAAATESKGAASNEAGTGRSAPALEAAMLQGKLAERWRQTAEAQLGERMNAEKSLCLHMVGVPGSLHPLVSAGPAT